MEICDVLMTDILSRVMAGIRETGQDCDAATLVVVSNGEGVQQYGYLYDPEGNRVEWPGPVDTRTLFSDYRALSSPLFPEPWHTCVIRLDHAAGRLDVEHLDELGVPEVPAARGRHLQLVA